MALAVLAGVSGAGKTTVARILEEHGYRVAYTDTSGCVTYGDVIERQICFAIRVTGSVLSSRDEIVDNSILTVAGYTAAWAHHIGIPTLWRIHALLETLHRGLEGGTRVILLVAGGEAEERRAKRGRPEPPVPSIVHRLAELEMMRIARLTGAVVIDTRGRKPEEVAEEVARYLPK